MQKRKGSPYKSAAEAKKRCKPADVFCCIDGKIKNHLHNNVNSIRELPIKLLPRQKEM